MEERSEVRRLPRGERCSQCGDRKYYLENGMRFCASNGHEIEGFVQFDVGDEEDSGRLGAVAKREKEFREREKRQLTGIEGKSLFLEALQLILRNQLLWLVHERGHKEELETVVRDLWDLRIRAFSSLVLEEGTGHGELEMFSSQALSDNTDVVKPRAKAQSWDPEKGSNWPLPRMIDTLGLCYLGCVLLRIPTRIGELFRWACGGIMPYTRTYYDLPQEMQDRMPSTYTRAIKLPLHTPLEGGELHRAILQLSLGYHYNYGMVFPGINDVPILIQYSRFLALPVESIRTARSLSAILGCSFEFPTGKARIFPIDHPEILLVSILIVASKLCFPFHGPQMPWLDFQRGQAQELDWTEWARIIGDSEEGIDFGNSRKSFEDMTADRVASMTEGELDEYFGHIASLVDRKNEDPVVQFFPIENPPPSEPPLPEVAQSEIDERAQEVLAAAIGSFPPPSGQSESSPDKDAFYETFRTVEKLPTTARKFYATAAHASGLRLETLVRSVYMLEQRIITWQRKQRRPHDNVDSSQGR